MKPFFQVGMVVENLESFLPLAETSADVLLIWGSGWKCLQLADLISRLPGRKFYWGDIDKEGLEIASYFCHETGASPVYMDRESLDKFEHLSQKVSYSTPLKELAILQDLYAEICRRRIRVEQEKISFEWPVITT